jgi:hypothetical protein
LSIFTPASILLDDQSIHPVFKPPADPQYLLPCSSYKSTDSTQHDAAPTRGIITEEKIEEMPAINVVVVVVQESKPGGAAARTSWWTGRL